MGLVALVAVLSLVLVLVIGASIIYLAPNRNRVQRSPTVCTVVQTNSTQSSTTSTGTATGTGTLSSIPGFGNTVRVDKIYGDDFKGVISGAPFLTIGAALKYAATINQNTTPCFCVWIFPGTYTESELVIPPNVSVIGLDASASIAAIQGQFKSLTGGKAITNKSLVGMNGLAANGVVIRTTVGFTPLSGSVTGIHMSAGASLSNVVVWVDTNDPAVAANLTAVDMAGAASSVKNCILIADGTNLPDTFSGVTVAAVSTSATNPSRRLIPDLADCTLCALGSPTFGSVTVASLNLNVPGWMLVSDCAITGTGISGAGVRSQNDGANGVLQGCIVSGSVNDVTSSGQTTIIEINSTTLVGLGKAPVINGFTTKLYSFQQSWGVGNVLYAGGTTYLPLGIVPNFTLPAPTPFLFVVNRSPTIAYQMSLTIKTTGEAPGKGIKVTLQKISSKGVVTATNLTASLTLDGSTDYQQVNSEPNDIACLASGDILAVFMEASALVTITDVSVTVNYY